MEGDDELDDARPAPTPGVSLFSTSNEAGLPCGCHGPEAVCDRCPARYDTDGHGFPHPRAVPRGARRLRHCPSCGELVSPEQWDTSRRRPGRGLPELGRWQCLQCTVEDADG